MTRPSPESLGRIRRAPAVIVQLVLGAHLALVGAIVLAEGGPPGDKKDAPAKGELVLARGTVTKGATFDAGLRMTMKPKWHVYWHSPRDGGVATKIEWNLPDGVTAREIEWPTPKRFVDPGDIISYGYSNEVVLPVQFDIAEDYAGETIEIRGKATWLVCKDYCIQGEAELSGTVKIADTAGPVDKKANDAIARARMVTPKDSAEMRILDVREFWDAEKRTWTVEWSTPAPSGELPPKVHEVKLFPHDPVRGKVEESAAEAWASKGTVGGRVTFTVDVFSAEFKPESLGVTIVPSDWGTQTKVAPKGEDSKPESASSRPKKPHAEYAEYSGIPAFVVRHKPRDE